MAPKRFYLYDMTTSIFINMIDIIIFLIPALVIHAVLRIIRRLFKRIQLILYITNYFVSTFEYGYYLRLLIESSMMLMLGACL
jgi:hypothetical protein